MTNPQPLTSYNPASLTVGPRGAIEITGVEWSVPSSHRIGHAYTVALDPATQTLICACPQRTYRRVPCKHEASVLRGEHKPRVTVRPRPAPAPAPRPAPRLADTPATICGSVSDLDIYGDDTDRTALDRRLAAMRGAA